MDFITSDIYGNENGYLRHSGIGAMHQSRNQDSRASL